MEQSRHAVEEKLDKSLLENSVHRGVSDLKSISPSFSGAGSKPTLNPAFEFNRSLPVLGVKQMLRSNVPFSPVDSPQYRSALDSRAVFRRHAIETKMMGLKDGWNMKVDKYILGQTIGPLVGTDHIDLLNRVVYGDSYIKTKNAGDVSDETSGDDEDEEEGEEDKDAEEDEEE